MDIFRELCFDKSLLIFAANNSPILNKYSNILTQVFDFHFVKAISCKNYYRFIELMRSWWNICKFPGELYTVLVTRVVHLHFFRLLLLSFSFYANEKNPKIEICKTGYNSTEHLSNSYNSPTLTRRLQGQLYRIRFLI